MGVVSATTAVAVEVAAAASVRSITPVLDLSFWLFLVTTAAEGQGGRER